MEDNEQNFFIELAKVKTMQIHTESTTPLDIENAEGKLTVDVYHTTREIVVQSTIAGVKKEDINIYITNESVAIRGKRDQCEHIEEKEYIHQECFWGTFSRTVILPEKIDPNTSKATFKNSILTIRMPKINQKKIRKIKIKEEEKKSP